MSRFQSQVSPRGDARKREGPAACHFPGLRHRKKSLWHIRKIHMHFEKVAEPSPRFPLFGRREIPVPWHILSLGEVCYIRVRSEEPPSIPFRARRLTLGGKPPIAWSSRLLLPAAATSCRYRSRPGMHSPEVKFAIIRRSPPRRWRVQLLRRALRRARSAWMHRRRAALAEVGPECTPQKWPTGSYAPVVPHC